jgi:hypothetical protein
MKKDMKGLYESIDELYQFFELLGEGTFSKVYRALFHPTGEYIAVKVSIYFSLYFVVDNETRIRKLKEYRAHELRGRTVALT